MPQALHIFRKDVRYLWKEIILVLLLCALFARGYSAWIEPLLIVAAGYLIARLIHAEAIPGDRQFWVTRPYRWKSLLTAKLLFIMAFVNLPICAAQLSMLISAGFSVTSNLGGLAGSQVLLVLCVSLPIAALAALTPGIMAFILSALILLAAGFTIQQIELPRIRLLRPAPVAPPWPEQVKWVRDAAVLTAVIAGAAGILQYRKRGASWSRTVAFGATACAIASWVFMPPWMALAVQTHLSKHVSEFSTVEIVPDLGTKQLPVRHPNWTADPHLFLPLLVKALPHSVDIRADTLAVSLRAPDGRTWNSDVAGVRKSSTTPGTMALEAEIVMPRSYFDGENGQPLSLRASFWGTLFGNSHSQTIPLPYKPANVMDGLRCVMGEFNYLYCRSAFRWPAKLVYAQFHDNDVSSFNMLISYSPFPASLGLNPFESHWISAGARTRDVKILTKEPLAHLRRDFEVAGVRLVEAP